MESWEVKIKLKIRGLPWKVKIGFTFEWKAWLLAYDLTKKEPEDFYRLDFDLQMLALAYGAAVWHLMKKGRRVWFTYEDIAEALYKASKADNKKIEIAMSNARFPDWLKLQEDVKKNENP